jgi:hypothetical protein
MRSLAVRWAGGVTQLVDRNEDDASGSVEVGFKNLNHGDSLSIKLQDTAFGPSGRIIYRLGQFDNVELRDFLSHCHQDSMLGAWIGRDQSWRAISAGVVPRSYYWGTSAVNSQVNVDPAGDAVGPVITNNNDHGSNSCLGKAAPENSPVAEIDVEHSAPFRAVSFLSKYPVFDLSPFVPSVLGTRKNFSRLSWPLHSEDAMERRCTCVELESGLWLQIHTKGVQR